MAQHGGNSIVPLKFKTLSQLIGFLWGGLTPTPHLRPHGLYGSVCSDKVAGGSKSVRLLKAGSTASLWRNPQHLWAV